MTMSPSELERAAERLLRGETTVAEFVTTCGPRGSAELGEVTLDLDRRRRCGFSEVVYGEGKSVESLVKIFDRLLAERHDVLATRITADKAAELRARFPLANYNPLARTLRLDAPEAERETGGRVAVVTAGTSDLPVAEEARETLEWMGIEVTMVHDVGVAGPHRLPAQLPKLLGQDAIVVVAGLEGALPSVVGGYVECPVIGVPTSVGYGASFGGLAALLGMLNSCASNVTVVNIDGGFKGAYVAGVIARGRAKAAHGK